MKRYLLRCLLPALLVIPFIMTSCDEDDDWSSYIDPRLVGRWELVAVNGMGVDPDDANYFEFDDDGDGEYYYFRNGRLYEEDIWFSCEDYGGPDGQQLNISYESGRFANVSYWLTDRGSTLMMQWFTSSGSVTYTYGRIDYIPY